MRLAWATAQWLGLSPPSLELFPFLMLIPGTVLVEEVVGRIGFLLLTGSSGF